MAKTAKEKSTAAKGLEMAQGRLRTAKEHDAKASTAATKKAVADAMADVKRHADVVNRERFEDVAGTRFGNVIKALKNLTNCASTRSYKFGVPDVDLMEKVGTDALKSCIQAFRAGLAGTGETKTEGTGKFKFG